MEDHGAIASLRREPKPVPTEYIRRVTQDRLKISNVCCVASNLCSEPRKPTITIHAIHAGIWRISKNFATLGVFGHRRKRVVRRKRFELCSDIAAF
ncbi:hypothetical protein RB195_010046 [Necator americanus]|uniref:Uncharacterized protein n=1 Tax=Necator americanus TaxID=51031 RepID=A0ABR1CW63_NECAM